MATKTAQMNGAPKMNGVANKKPAAPRAPVRKAAGTPAKTAQKSAKPVQNKAYSVAGDNPSGGATSAYAIMANRIANRVAEMAESITFVER